MTSRSPSSSATRLLLLAVLGGLLFVTVRPSAAADVDALLVGNSYIASNNLRQHVQTLLAESPAWPDSRVEAHHPGGRRLVQHLQDSDGTNGDTQLREWMVTGDDAWAFVLLQEQSQIPSFQQSDPAVVESVASAVGLDDLVEAKGAETVFFQTWGRRDGDSQNDWRNPDYETMQQNLEAGYEAYRAATATAERPTWIAPVGGAFRIISQQDDALFQAMYVGDGSHPTVPGTYLAALVITSTWTGRDPRRAVWTPDGVTPEQAEVLRDAAWQATVGNAYELAFPWMFDWSDWSNPDDAGPGTWAVSGTGVEPLVTLEAEAQPLSRLAVGAEQAGLGGSGRLVLRPGGQLAASEVVIGEHEDSVGSLLIDGGALEAEAIDGGDGKGALRMTGGSLLAGTVTLALDQVDGTYTPTGTAPALDSWTMLGGRAELTMTGTSPTLVIAGDAALGGTLAITVDATTLAQDQAVTLIQAASIDGTGLTVEAPDNLTWELQDAAEGQILVASLGDVPDPPEIPDPEDIIDDVISEACGCGGAEESAAALLLLLPLGLRRRR
jgi:hypothetical protein